MFTIQDMMEMVKAGKTNEEIKELYSIGKEITESTGSGAPAGADPGAGTQPKEPEQKPAETDPAGKEPDPDKGPDPDTDGDDKTDWKQKAEEMTEKYNALKEKYQQQNVRQNMQGQFDDQKSSIEKGLDILSEMVR